MDSPVVARPKPCLINVKAGRSYFWCSCGRSRNQPFCDGSHKGTGLAPLQHIPAKSAKVWFCGCKATGKSPLCDGTHNRL